MWLINYICSNSDCSYATEELLQSSAEAKEIPAKTCPLCGDPLVKFDFKNNQHRWRFHDQ